MYVRTDAMSHHAISGLLALQFISVSNTVRIIADLLINRRHFPRRKLSETAGWAGA